MLCTLSNEHRQCLAQLATFPSGFDEAGAAAVIGRDISRASSLLVVLYNHKLVAWDASTNTYSLHSMVRTCAVEDAKKDLVQHAKVCFVSHIFKQMDSWADIYNTRAWRAPLAMVQERGPDIRAAFALAREWIKGACKHPARFACCKCVALAYCKPKQKQHLNVNTWSTTWKFRIPFCT